MTVSISKPPENLHSVLNDLRSKSKYAEITFHFDGDGSATDFDIRNGYKPVYVYDDGALKKEGSGDDYEVVYDGYTYTVSFAVAPASGNDVAVIGVRENY